MTYRRIDRVQRVVYRAPSPAGLIVLALIRARGGQELTNADIDLAHAIVADRENDRKVDPMRAPDGGWPGEVDIDDAQLEGEGVTEQAIARAKVAS